jgi:hypothetical protein
MVGKNSTNDRWSNIGPIDLGEKHTYDLVRKIVTFEASPPPPMLELIFVRCKMVEAEAVSS